MEHAEDRRAALSSRESQDRTSSTEAVIVHGDDIDEEAEEEDDEFEFVTTVVGVMGRLSKLGFVAQVASMMPSGAEAWRVRSVKRWRGSGTAAPRVDLR